VASALVILVGGAAIHLRQAPALTLPPVVFFYGALGAGFLLSLAVAGVLRVWTGRGTWLVGYLQVTADAALTTVLVYATGGQDSVLTFLYPLNTLYAAALLSPSGGYVAALSNSAGFAGMVAALGAGWLSRVDDPGVPYDREAYSVVLATVGACLLVAMLGGQLSLQLRHSGERLRKARQDLSALQSLHTAIVQSISSGLISVDTGGTVKFLNPAAEGILGLEGGQAIGRPLGQVLPAWAAPPVAGARSGDTTYAHPSGRLRHVAFSSSPLGAAEAGHAGHVVILKDVTDQLELEAAMLRSRRLATVGEFAAGLAHELRNPLGSMIGCVELLRRDAARTPDEDRLLGIVHREAERLAHLVSDFLKYARPQDPQLDRVAVDPLLEEMAAEAGRDRDQGRPVTVGSRCGLEVLADASQVRQVLWNLLRNAAEASPPGEPIVLGAEPANLAAASEGGHVGGRPAVRITVTDRGPGVGADEERALFDPFFSTKPGGTGLGLAIVHRIVEAHGGIAGLAKPGGPGATFYVILPQPAGDVARPESSPVGLPAPPGQPEPASRAG
jgi:two-component system sensor histidine kinase PilS (NtrC family)